jgi:hypothetical protein
MVALLDDLDGVSQRFLVRRAETILGLFGVEMEKHDAPLLICRYQIMADKRLREKMGSQFFAPSSRRFHRL